MTVLPRTVWMTTSVALVAFASNSILCRLAMGSGAIDAASFTSVRVLSGALVLFILSRALGDPRAYTAGSWFSASALTVYALAFSFAYVNLTAGVGALLLFGAVQTTIILAALLAGERATWLEGVGLATALLGVLYLVSPSVTAPPLLASTLMIVAGIAWGVYTVRGQGALVPLRTTTGNFARAVPLVVIALGLATPVLKPPIVTAAGIGWAVASGGLTSALGYVVWYAALRSLTRIRAATVQLSVPALTAAGGVMFLGERVTLRLVVAAALILGGIALSVAVRPTTVSPER